MAHTSPLEQTTAHNSDGWLWPVSDTCTYKYLTESEPDIPDWVISHAANRRVIVQAGGNCGLYVEKYAQNFQQVFTFEPDARNFRCLVHNVGYPNVFFYRAALGSKSGSVDLVIQENHLGGTRVTEGASIPVITLDSFGLETVDVIHFDIEGFEIAALQGAAEIIKRCRPAIAIEINNGCEAFGITKEEVVKAVEKFGYGLKNTHKSEYVFWPNKDLI